MVSDKKMNIYGADKSFMYEENKSSHWHIYENIWKYSLNSVVYVFSSKRRYN